MKIICHICGSDKITHYRQIRVDGVAVVTARCENEHIPEKGKPFYSVALFNISDLPLLPSQQNDPVAQQAELFKKQDEEIREIWKQNEEPVKKYPRLSFGKSNGKNIPVEVSNEQN